ncbi:MAG TPA: sugar phosphate isomerase/epimerase [Thermomicrobiales bacterium]|nr:sugar phosphate isomerase/epimerase [Thermomicrobiales bacterium]
MQLAYQTNTWGGVVGHPAGVTSVKDLYYLANGSTEEALTDIAGVGYQGFELFDGNLMQYAGREDDLRGLMERLRLELVGVYSGANFIYPEILGEELSKIEEVAGLAARLGATHLVVGGGAIRASGTEDRDYQLLAKGLDQVVALADRVGLTASFHPHLGTCAQSPEQIASVFEQTSIGFCPDTAHLEAGGGDPADLIRTYAGRIPYVHLKDYADGAFLPLGQGRQDFPQIMSGLRAAGYDGWLTVELDAYAGHPADAAAVSKTFLDEMLAGRGAKQ